MSRPNTRSTGPVVAALVAVVLCQAGGCTPKQYAQQADRAAGRVLVEGQRVALPEPMGFEVDYQPYRPRRPEGPIAVGDKAIPLDTSADPTVLSVEDCLAVAFANSRSLQDRKEILYAQALAVASSRRGWDVPLLAGTITGDLDVERQQGGETASDLFADGEVSLTQRLRDGGVITLAAAMDVAIDLLVGGESTTVGSLLEANFTQPLLQGAWRGLAYEDQYRRERDFLFSLWDYERFKQNLAVDIYSRYFNVLQQRDELENERANIARLRRSVRLTQALAAGGEASQIEVDQAMQNLLDAQVRFEFSLQTYEDALDRFKITLGLPLAAAMAVDYPGALGQLKEVGKKDVSIEEAEAVNVAFTTRPDVLLERAAVRDADRDVTIAADRFLPQLDVQLGYNAPGTDPAEFYRVQFHRHNRFAQLTLDYNLDQTDNRDRYRLSLLALDKARRDWAEFRDEVVLQVRDAYRTLLRTSRSYDLQVANVEIARRRTKLAELQQEQGQASARDVLEAQEALRQAQNGLTRSLVTYTTTRLDFLATVGMIRVDAQGQIHERTEPLTFEGIAEKYPYVTEQ